MTGAGINFSSVVDLGFVLLVTAVSIRSLTTSSLDGEKFASRWRRELRELERVLRDLITEAGNASSNLDRRLMKRKSELETLLKKLEQSARGKEAKVQESQPRGESRRQPQPERRVERRPEEQTWSLGEIEELPNDSWIAESYEDTESDASEEADLERYQDEDPAGDLGPLEELVESAADTLELSTRLTQAAAREQKAQISAPQKQTGRPAAGKTTSSALAAQIEKINSNAKQSKLAPPEATEEENDEIFRRLSIMDQTAYKIARRLLAAGTEIHVVARKLDLPVSEIRLLDRLMREHGEAILKQTGVGPNYKPTETVPRRKIVRDRVATAAEKKRAEEEKRNAPASGTESFIELTDDSQLGGASLDEIIEREIALL